jgi:hypothetical protein
VISDPKSYPFAIKIPTVRASPTGKVNSIANSNKIAKEGT